MPKSRSVPIRRKKSRLLYWIFCGWRKRIDMIIDHAKAVLTEKFIKELHWGPQSGTSDSGKDWFAVGNYKKLPNEVGGMTAALPDITG